jgi:hypothetical protein
MTTLLLLGASVFFNLYQFKALHEASEMLDNNVRVVRTLQEDLKGTRRPRY